MPPSRSRRVALLALVFAACAACGGSGGAPAGGVGDGAADGSTAPTCAQYCATIATACTASNQQYSALPECMASCLAFAVGSAADTAGDTLGCRLVHARKAAVSADQAAQHCTHAGPGGDGVCGDNCAGFCDIAMMYCTAANNAQIYDSRAACLADCATHLTDMKLDTGSGPRTDMGNQVACMLYHAQQGAVAPQEHCPGDLALNAGTCR
jgi:hypothetical protein